MRDAALSVPAPPMPPIHDSVDELLERIRRTLGSTGIKYEILFVDDSDDQTPETIAAHTATGSPVRLLHRSPGTRAGGLGGALCAGFAEARGSHALCIDGDLQHPPELLAPMAREHGKSNVSMREGLPFVRHLARLRFDPAVRRDRPAANDTGQALDVPSYVPETPDQLITLVVGRTAA